jgi:hypothetical protein
MLKFKKYYIEILIFVLIGVFLYPSFLRAEMTWGYSLRNPLMGNNDDWKRFMECGKKLIKRNIPQLDGEYNEGQGMLEAALKEILLPLKDGNISIERIKKLFSEHDKEIYNLISKLKQNRLKASLFSQDFDRYATLNLTEHYSPDSALCQDLSRCLRNSIIELDLEPQYERFYYNGNLVHICIKIEMPESKDPVAIDLAYGQFFSNETWHIEIAPLNEHKKTIAGAINEWYSYDNKRRISSFKIEDLRLSFKILTQYYALLAINSSL